MNYRFSPIQSKEQLVEAIEYLHFACFGLCKKTLGVYLPVSGNIGIFCHYDDEYAFLTGIRKELTDESDHWNKKYYRLHESITISAKDDVHDTTYTYLYVRKPDHHTEVGDVDFVLDKDRFGELLKLGKAKETVNGVELFYRPDLDMVRLSHPDVDALPYITTKYMQENISIS